VAFEAIIGHNSPIDCARESIKTSQWCGFLCAFRFRKTSESGFETFSQVIRDVMATSHCHSKFQRQLHHKIPFLQSFEEQTKLKIFSRRLIWV